MPVAPGFPLWCWRSCAPRLLGQDRPSMTALQRRISEKCAAEGVTPPVRASLYNALTRIEGHTYAVADLPAPVSRRPL